MSGSYCNTLLLLQLCVLCAARFAGSNEFRNDYSYMQHGDAGGWFKLHRVPLDWHTARAQCYHEGAVLASPLNAGIWSIMKKIVSEAKPTLRQVYSGVHATFSDGVFTSVEGIPLESLFVEWTDDQPNNFKGNQQCTVVEDSRMNDFRCDVTLPYICYRKLSVSDEVTECGTVDKDYKLDARTGHCYKFHARAESWTRALRICRAEGGHLAVIDSEAEADLLKELFANFPRLLHTAHQNSASVGFREWGYGNSWWTIHGKMLEDTEYAQWSQGQPDDARAPGASDGQACGAIFRTGKLDDVWCDVPMAFICEKTKQSLVRFPDEFY